MSKATQVRVGYPRAGPQLRDPHLRPHGERTRASQINRWDMLGKTLHLMSFNGDLMVINPLAMAYEWLVGGLEHEFYWECHHPN